MNILFSYRSKEEKQFAMQELGEHTITFVEGSLNESKWNGEGIECISVFVNSHITREVIDELPNLKLITTRSTGYDHIDVEYAREKNITVSTVPGYGEHAVAEFTFALLLALVRKVYEGAKRVDEGDFHPDGLMGFDLFGKTIGVVGTGAIGKSVMRIAKGFGMNVIAFDIHPDLEYAKNIDAEYKTFEELLKESDVVSLHAPENLHTHNMMNKEKFSLMKKGSMLVNTARGGLIDTEALVDALKENILLGVALDVLAEEENIADEMKFLHTTQVSENSLKIAVLNHYLIEHPRVLITPHMAFNTKEAQEIILKTTIDSILSFAKGEKKNAV